LPGPSCRDSRPPFPGPAFGGVPKLPIPGCMRHRLLPQLFASACLGAGVTVAVAWAWALWGPGINHRAFQRFEPSAWPGPVPSDWPTIPGGAGGAGERVHYVQLGHDLIRVHGDNQAERDADPSVPRRAYFMTAHATGLPAPAMVRLQRSTLAAGAINDFDWELALPSWLPHARGLPVRPVWPGFAIDTVFYGCICFAALSARQAIRRRVRSIRGWCQGCGYDLSGISRPASVCPECGT
jgi:hypothetical protein